MGKTYTQTVNSSECSLAVEKFLIAPYGTSFSKARVDMAALPTGFLDLGSVVEDTPSIKVTRSKYQLKLGIPKVLQYEQVTEVSAEIGFSIYSNTAWQAQFALANSAMTTVTTVNSATADTLYLGKNTVVYYTLLGVADFLNGSQVVHEFTKVTAGGDFEEAFRPEAANAIKLTFAALGVPTTIDSCSHLCVGKRHYFGPNNECTS